MAEQASLQWIYQFFPVRPEMVNNPDLWTEADSRLAAEHFAYLKRGTEEEARHFMENDPFVSGGFARARLHPFRAALVRKSRP